MNILIAPDSYKGCLSATEVAKAMELGIKSLSSDIETISIPFADGGEGTVEAIISGAGGEIVKTKVTGPLGNQTDSFFGILDDKLTAVIEMAAASGLSLVPDHLKNPMETTTFGTGELVIKALDIGCENIIIGVGGSATNDCGTGLARALGVSFYDKNRKELKNGGKILANIASYDTSGLDKRIKTANIIVACDVDNPLYGTNGAAYVYAGQKGADEAVIKSLDKGLMNINDIVLKQDSLNMHEIPGSGAAGGLAGGLVAFTGAKLENGFDIVSKVCNLDSKIQASSLIITGEGQTDFQTAFGKVPVGIAQLAKKHGIPVFCISGSFGKGYEKVYDLGINSVFSISNGPSTLENLINNASQYIMDATRNAVSAWLAGTS